MNISDLLIKDNILLNLSVSSKLDAFKELSSKLLINNCIISTPFSEGKLCARAIFAKRTTRGGTQQRIGSLSRRTAFFLWTLRACANSAFARRKRGFTKFFGILKKQHGNAVSATAPTKTNRAAPCGRRSKTVCSRKSNTICILLCKPRTVCGPQAKNGRKRTKK